MSSPTYLATTVPHAWHFIVNSDGNQAAFWCDKTEPHTDDVTYCPYVQPGALYAGWIVMTARQILNPTPTTRSTWLHR